MRNLKSRSEFYEILEGALFGSMGATLALSGSIAALSSNDILTKVAGISLALVGSTIAYKGLSQDTIYENYKPQELIYMSLKGLYKKIRRK